MKQTWIEALRALAMLLICAQHICTNSQCLEISLRDAPTLCIGSHFIMAVSSISVQLYAMITGYVSLYSSWKPAKAINILAPVIFWMLALALLNEGLYRLGITSYHLSAGELMMGRIPTPYWYVNAYLMLFLLMPLLNRYLKHFLKKPFLALIFLSAGSLSAVSAFTPFHGSGPCLLILCYIMGAYLKRFPATLSCRKAALICAVCAVSQTLFFLFCSTPFVQLPFFPLTLFFSYATFVLVSHLGTYTDKAKHFFLCSGSLTFGVYLIHVHPYFWNLQQLYLPDLLKTNETPLLLLIVTAGSIFFVCMLFERGRKVLFDKLHITQMIQNFIKTC